MKEANTFFNGLLDSGSNFNKCKLGRVVKFNAAEMKADIQPLPSGENSLLINVPVMTFVSKSFYVRLPIEVGDMVLVVFADNDLDNILLGGDNKATERKHDLSDAICIGGVLSFTGGLPGQYGEDLVLAKRDNSAKVVIKKDGNIDIQGQTINISASSDVNISAGGDVNVDGSFVKLNS